MGDNQLETAKIKGEYKIKQDKENWDRKIEVEKLRHKNIMEELEVMKKAKITQFVRQIKEELK